VSKIIAKCRLPIADLSIEELQQSAIGNWQSAIDKV
jgi:hypothetical protein